MKLNLSLLQSSIAKSQKPDQISIFDLRSKPKDFKMIRLKSFNSRVLLKW